MLRRSKSEEPDLQNEWETYGAEDPTHEYKQKAHDEALTALPGYMVKIIGNYRMHAYWFEVFECVRKLALVGLLVPIGQVCNHHPVTTSPDGLARADRTGKD